MAYGAKHVATYQGHRQHTKAIIKYTFNLNILLNNRPLVQVANMVLP